MSLDEVNKIRIQYHEIFKVGRFLGYPVCCTFSFVMSQPTDLQIEMSYGTGFIPCLNHARHLKDVNKPPRSLLRGRMTNISLDDITVRTDNEEDKLSTEIDSYLKL